MPRRKRCATTGLVFHVLNRAAKRARLFENSTDYHAFERILAAALDRGGVTLFAYCIMPNHWHLLLSPTDDNGLSRFMHWLTTTHARRWQLCRKLEGQGAVYQGRYKAIAVSDDQHFLTVCRYVERNALRASLVERAEDWPWSSLAGYDEDGRSRVMTAAWPVARPPNWPDYVNMPHSASELDEIRAAIKSNRPFGSEGWKQMIAASLQLPSPGRGRPAARNGVGGGFFVNFKKNHHPKKNL
jgi:putative transposase